VQLGDRIGPVKGISAMRAGKLNGRIIEVNAAECWIGFRNDNGAHIRTRMRDVQVTRDSGTRSALVYSTDAPDALPVALTHDYTPTAPTSTRRGGNSKQRREAARAAERRATRLTKHTTPGTDLVSADHGGANHGGA